MSIQVLIKLAGFMPILFCFALWLLFQVYSTHEDDESYSDPNMFQTYATLSKNIHSPKFILIGIGKIYTHWNWNSKLGTKLSLEFQVECRFKLEFQVEKLIRRESV